MLLGATVKLPLPSASSVSAVQPSAAPASASLVKAVPLSRYSALSSPAPTSAAVTLTVCVSLKNRPKEIRFRKFLKLLFRMAISAVGGVLSYAPTMRSRLLLKSAVTWTV